MAPHSLRPDMTVTEFDNGYWYATDLKAFAKQLGINNSSRLRKDELESLIKNYLRTGQVPQAKRRDINPTGPKDSENGLTADLPVRHFTNNAETWSFLDRHAREIDPGFKRRSGTKYRLNRWRDEQLTKGEPITYGDLAAAYVDINNSKEPRSRIKGTYYMYFLQDYMSHEPHADRDEGIEAWHQLKSMDIPKTYDAWKKHTA